MPDSIASNSCGAKEVKRALAAAMREKMRKDRVSVSALAERMGTARTAARRILDPDNTAITLRSMINAAMTMGLKIKLVAEPMSPEELAKLAHQLAACDNPGEADKLEAAIIEGFYAGS